MVLQSHYRAPLTFTDESLEAAARGLERLTTAARPVERETTFGESTGLQESAQQASRDFHAAMDDDFNTPAALAALFDLARQVNRARDAGAPCEEVDTGRSMLIRLAAILGLDLEASAFLGGDAAPFIDLLVECDDRLATEKQWALSDLIATGWPRMDLDCGRSDGNDLASELSIAPVSIPGQTDPAATSGSTAAMPSTKRSGLAGGSFTVSSSWRAPGRIPVSTPLEREPDRSVFRSNESTVT